MKKTDTEKLVDNIKNGDNVKAHEVLKHILVYKASKRIAQVLKK